MLRHLWLLSLLGCVESNAILCANGETCPATWQCDDAHGGCIVQEQRDACMGLGDGTECIAPNVSDEGVCDAGVCLTNVCGDGYRARAESCDGAALGQVASCTQLGYYDEVALGCTATCELDTATCTGFCGDDVVNGDEECDGALPERTCVDFGYLAGAIECASTCGPDLAACVSQGWRVVPMPAAALHVHGTSASNVWVVGDAGMVRRFDGATWQVVDVSACTTQEVFYVHVLSPTDAFLLDESGIVRVNAAGCTKYELQVQERFHSIWATSLDDAYVGFDGTDVGTWHFDGTSWSQADTTRARFIWGSGPSDVYTATQRSGSLRHFDGASWSDVPVPGMNQVLGLWGTGPSDIYVAGTIPRLVGNTNVDRGAIAHWDGTSWTTLLDDPPWLAGTELPYLGTRVGSAAGARAIVVGYNGNAFLAFGWDGERWAVLGAPSAANSMVTYVAPDGTVYLTGGRTDVVVFEGAIRLETAPLTGQVLEVYVPDDPALLATTRAVVNNANYKRVWAFEGGSWQIEAIVDDVAVLPDGQTFVVHQPDAPPNNSTYPAGVFRRTGRNQYELVSGVSGPFLAGTSATDLWVVDPGPNSMAIHIGPQAAVRVDTLGFADASRILALTPTRAFAFSATTTTMATYDGTTWSTPTAGPVAAITGVHAASATDAYAWSVSQIQHFDGTSWTLLSPPPPDNRIEHVWGSRNNLFVAGDLGMHYYNGVRWTPVDTGYLVGMRGIAGRGDSIVFNSFEGVRRIYRTRTW